MTNGAITTEDLVLLISEKFEGAEDGVFEGLVAENLSRTVPGEVFATDGESTHRGFVVTGLGLDYGTDEAWVDVNFTQVVSSEHADEEVRALLDAMSVRELRDAYWNGSDVADEANSNLACPLDEVVSDEQLSIAVAGAFATMTGIDVRLISEVVTVNYDQDDLEVVEAMSVRAVTEEYLDAEGASPYEEDEEDEW